MLYGVYWDRYAAERLFPCRSQYSSTSRWEIIPFHNLITPKALGTELKKCCSDYKKKMKCQYDVLIPFCLFFLWLYVLFRRWCYFCMKNSNCVEISIWSMLKDFDQEILVIAWQFNIYSPLLGASSIKGIVKPKAKALFMSPHSGYQLISTRRLALLLHKVGRKTRNCHGDPGNQHDAEALPDFTSRIQLIGNSGERSRFW